MCHSTHVAIKKNASNTALQFDNASIHFKENTSLPNFLGTLYNVLSFGSGGPTVRQ